MLVKLGTMKMVGCSLLLSATVMAATTVTASAIFFHLPVPGSAQQVRALVTASTSTERLPVHLDPPLLDAQLDNVLNTYLHVGGCLTARPQCYFAHPHSKRLVVLFGDSHAWMWVDAIVPVLEQRGYRLQLIWKPSCPAASVSVWYLNTHRAYRDCDSWRAAMIKVISAEHPSLVLLSERTVHLLKSATTLVTGAQLKAGMERTIGLLRPHVGRVAIITDIPAYNNFAAPQICLSLHETAVQKCATPLLNPVPAWATHARAERAAAVATGAATIDPTPWLCHRARCSPVIGRYLSYLDWSHVSATYSAYLSNVMGRELTALLTS